MGEKGSEVGEVLSEMSELQAGLLLTAILTYYLPWLYFL